MFLFNKVFPELMIVILALSALFFAGVTSATVAAVTYSISIIWSSLIYLLLNNGIDCKAIADDQKTLVSNREIPDVGIFFGFLLVAVFSLVTFSSTPEGQLLFAENRFSILFFMTFFITSVVQISREHRRLGQYEFCLRSKLNHHHLGLIIVGLLVFVTVDLGSEIQHAAFLPLLFIFLLFHNLFQYSNIFFTEDKVQALESIVSKSISTTTYFYFILFFSYVATIIIF